MDGKIMLQNQPNSSYNRIEDFKAPGHRPGRYNSETCNKTVFALN